MTALRAEWRAELMPETQPRHPLAGTTLAQGETGNRKVCCGHDSFQVTGGGHGGRPSGNQLFSLQPSEPWCQLHPDLVPSGHRALGLCTPANYPVSLCVG